MLRKKSQPARHALWRQWWEALKRVSAGNGSCSAAAHSPVATGRFEGKLPCVDRVWGDEEEKSVSHIWYYTAWIEKNGLGEARPEVTENSAEVKIRIKGMRTNVRSPRNYQIGGVRKAPIFSKFCMLKSLFIY